MVWCGAQKEFVLCQLVAAGRFTHEPGRDVEAVAARQHSLQECAEEYAQDDDSAGVLRRFTVMEANVKHLPYGAVVDGPGAGAGAPAAPADRESHAADPDTVTIQAEGTVQV